MPGRCPLWLERVAAGNHCAPHLPGERLGEKDKGPPRQPSGGFTTQSETIPSKSSRNLSLRGVPDIPPQFFNWCPKVPRLFEEEQPSFDVFRRSYVKCLGLSKYTP